MKFFVSKDIRENRSTVILLSGMMALILMYVLGSAWLLSETIGLSSSALRSNVLGSEASFTEPMALAEMVEMIHTALFIGSISIMITASVLLRLSRNDRFNLYVISGIFGSFVLLYGAVFMVRFVSESWIIAYQVGFFGYHGLMGMTSVWNGYRLFFPGARHGG